MANGGLRAVDNNRWPGPTAHSSGIETIGPEDRAKRLGAAGTHQPCQAENLSLSYLQTDVPQPGSSGQAFHMQRDVSLRMLAWLERLDRAIADHQPNDLVHRYADGGASSNHPPIAQHGNAIADLPDLFESVTYIKDAGSGVAKPAQVGEGELDLGICQRRRGLVEHQDSAWVGQCRGKRHQLLLAHAEPSDGQVRIEIGQADGGQRLERSGPEPGER